MFTLAGWGFVGTLSVVAGFASWQFAPPELVRSTTIDRTETGTIATSGGWSRSGSPTVRQIPIIEPAPPVRDEQLRADVQEIRRLLARGEQKADMLSQRVTLLENQTAVVMANIAEAASRPAAGQARDNSATEPGANTAAAKPSDSEARITTGGTQPAGTAAKSDPASAPPARTDTSVLPKLDSSTPAPKPDASAAPKPEAAASRADPAAAASEAARPSGGATAVTVIPVKPKTAEGSQIALNGSPGAIAKAPVATPTGQPTTSPATLRSGEANAPSSPAAPEPKEDAIGPEQEQARVGVDLGGFRNLAQLRKVWTDIGTKDPRLTKGLAPLAQLRETGDALQVRLIAGPFPNAVEAVRYCTTAKAAGLFCSATPYEGQPPK